MLTNVALSDAFVEGLPEHQDKSGLKTLSRRFGRALGLKKACMYASSRMTQCRHVLQRCKSERQNLLAAKA